MPFGAVARRSACIPSEREVVRGLVVVCVGLQHVAQVPQLDGLVLAVADQVAAVALGVQVRQAICVSHQQTSRLAAAQVTPVPHLQCMSTVM